MFVCVYKKKTGHGASCLKFYNYDETRAYAAHAPVTVCACVCVVCVVYMHMCMCVSKARVSRCHMCEGIFEHNSG